MRDGIYPRQCGRTRLCVTWRKGSELNGCGVIIERPQKTFANETEDDQSTPHLFSGLFHSPQLMIPSEGVTEAKHNFHNFSSRHCQGPSRTLPRFRDTLLITHVHPGSRCSLSCENPHHGASAGWASCVYFSHCSCFLI